MFTQTFCMSERKKKAQQFCTDLSRKFPLKSCDFVRKARRWKQFLRQLTFRPALVHKNLLFEELLQKTLKFLKESASKIRMTGRNATGKFPTTKAIKPSNPDKPFAVWRIKWTRQQWLDCAVSNPCHLKGKNFIFNHRITACNSRQ